MSKSKSVAKNTYSSQSLSQNENTLIASMRTSILPPPEEMERYEAICPGTLKTLLSTYEKQTNHRIELEKSVIESDIKNSRLGQIFAFILAMTSIVGGVSMILLGKDVQGLVAILAALGSLLCVFLGKNIKNSKKLLEKNKKNPEY